jgi:nitrilase
MHNTPDITRFIARESRSYVISVCGVLRRRDIPDGLPQVDLLRESLPDVIANGGSCIAAPDGSWVAAPLPEEERVIVATLHHARVREPNFGRRAPGQPDVLQLVVNRERQGVARFT